MLEDAVKYIREARNLKLIDDEIKMNLIDEGWSKKDVDKAFSFIDNKQKLTIPKPDYKSPHIKDTGNITLWDTFEHILMFISLYVMVVSIIILLNALVDNFLPGIKTTDFYERRNISNSTVRSTLASLIVSYPLFAYFFLKLDKRTKINPEVKGILPRKVLTYLTLITTFLTVLFYVIAIIYTLLSGNITFNFVLHFAVTVLVSSVVFIYYLNSVKEDRRSI